MCIRDRYFDPSGINGKYHCDGKCPCDPNSQVRDISQQGGQSSPKERVRYSDEVEPDAGQDSKTDINNQLGDQVTTHPQCGIIQHLCCKLKSAFTKKKKKTITQIFPLQKYEDD